VKTVADRYNQALVTGFVDLSTLMTLDDLEPPKKGFLYSDFFAILQCSAHFNTELQRNGWK